MVVKLGKYLRDFPMTRFHPISLDVDLPQYHQHTTPHQHQHQHAAECLMTSRVGEHDNHCWRHLPSNGWIHLLLFKTLTIHHSSLKSHFVGVTFICKIFSSRVLETESLQHFGKFDEFSKNLVADPHHFITLNLKSVCPQLD